MIKLNLETKTKEHEVLKQYLEENVSENLAKKINNGVRIEKDGKSLINKKTLDSFMKYACEEARKLAAKGATSACIQDEIVFGWAIHYFEEPDIIGSLYNQDGSEYKPTNNKPKTNMKTTPTNPITPKPTKPKPTQYSLFDFLTNTNNLSEKDIEENNDTETVEECSTENINENGTDMTSELNVDEETGEILSYNEPKENTLKGTTIYQKYICCQKQYPHAVIAYRLGDFYEIFGEYAIVISRELNLTLTGRNCGLDERIPMVGFPYHASDSYFRKIRQRRKVVIMEDNNIQILDKLSQELNDVKIEPVPTISEDVDDTNDIENIEEMKSQTKHIDKNALCILLDAFDEEIDVQ